MPTDARWKLDATRRALEAETGCSTREEPWSEFEAAVVESAVADVRAGIQALVVRAVRAETLVHQVRELVVTWKADAARWQTSGGRRESVALRLHADELAAVLDARVDALADVLNTTEE
jgi:hypothetical protein